MKPTPEMIEKAKLLAADSYACMGFDGWQCRDCPIDACGTIISRGKEKSATEWLKENGGD